MKKCLVAIILLIFKLQFFIASCNQSNKTLESHSYEQIKRVTWKIPVSELLKHKLHLEKLYSDYQRLCAAYARNKFYKNTRYEFHPTSYITENLIKNLEKYNQFIHDRLNNKKITLEEESEMLQILQLSQKDAQKLTILYDTYNQQCHNHQKQFVDFNKDWLQSISNIKNKEKIERNFIKKELSLMFTKMFDDNTLNPTKRLPNHLKILYEIYKNLEHHYALNLFYLGTKYQYKPEKRCQQIILQHLPKWNEFIRNQSKNNVTEETVDTIKTLQIHQKEALLLTRMCQKYNQQCRDDYLQQQRNL